jgi:hypothetical protein
MKNIRNPSSSRSVILATLIHNCELTITIIIVNIKTHILRQKVPQISMWSYVEYDPRQIGITQIMVVYFYPVDIFKNTHDDSSMPFLFQISLRLEPTHFST